MRLDSAALRALDLSGVAFIAEVTPEGQLSPVGDLRGKLELATTASPRIYTVVTCAAQRGEVEEINPRWREEAPGAAFMVLCATDVAGAAWQLHDRQTRSATPVAPPSARSITPATARASIPAAETRISVIAADPDERACRTPIVGGPFARIESSHGELVLTEGGITARVPTNPVRFGHLGFRRLKTVVDDRRDAQVKARKKGLPVPGDVPAAVTDAWTRTMPTWRSAETTTAAESVGRTLDAAMVATEARGVDLWDTLRHGSRFWRPGDGLTQALAFVTHGDVECFRIEDLCPPADLLKAFRASVEPPMSFPQFAQAYADWLAEGQRIESAVRAVVWAQARGRLAVFCCTDPFIPGYARASEWASNVPMGKREWPGASALRTQGCHRVVLADLLAQRLRLHGCEGEVLELDPTRQSAQPLPF